MRSGATIRIEPDGLVIILFRNQEVVRALMEAAKDPDLMVFEFYGRNGMSIKWRSDDPDPKVRMVPL